MTSSPLMLPPGSMMAFTPAAAAASILSRKGKNASDAIASPDTFMSVSLGFINANLVASIGEHGQAQISLLYSSVKIIQI